MSGKLVSRADADSGLPQYPTAQVTQCYHHWLVRLYCRIRFVILHQRFLREIGQYLPPQGRVLDIGCGFGLFALCFAGVRPGRTIYGIDLNASRIEMARRAAAELGLENVAFDHIDATALRLDEPFDAAYLLDIVHHIPPDTGRPLLEQIHARLDDAGGCLIIKDITTRPAYKRWFTWWLDKLMDYRTPVHYWPLDELHALLEDIGFRVRVHEMLDYLPYPHVLYVCTKRPAASG